MRGPIGGGLLEGIQIDSVINDLDAFFRQPFVRNQRLPDGFSHTQEPIAGTRQEPVKQHPFFSGIIGKPAPMLGKYNRRPASEESAGESVEKRGVLMRVN